MGAVTVCTYPGLDRRVVGPLGAKEFLVVALETKVGEVNHKHITVIGIGTVRAVTERTLAALNRTMNDLLAKYSFIVAGIAEVRYLVHKQVVIIPGVRVMAGRTQTKGNGRMLGLL